MIDLATVSFENNRATVYFDGISANELGTDVTFTLVKNGEVIGRTLTYNANAYLYRISIAEDEALAALAKAIYAYGKSAAIYQNP